VLVSLQRWTPLYWDQERYGMLVPLLALPFRDPLANLLVQRGLLILAGLASAVLLARWALAGRGARLAGILGAGTLLLLLPAPWLFEYLGDQPYGLSLALGLAGLLLVAPGDAGRRGRRWPRRGAALGLSLLAGWVNAGAGLFLAPVALARALADRLDGLPARQVLRRLAAELLLIGAGLLAGQACIWLYPVLSGHPLRLDLGTWPTSRWPWALWQLLSSGVRGAGLAWGAAVTGAALLGLLLPWAPEAAPPVAVAAGARPGARRRLLLRAALLLGAALAYALATAVLRWVAANQFHWRYLAPSLLLAHLCGLSLLAEPLARARRLRGPALAAALALLPAAAVAAFGPRSPAGVRADLDAALGRWTEDVLAARCDLVAGDYWTVWPAVWHAAWAARQRGLPAPYGLTHRANPTARFWKGKAPPELRICRVRGAEAEAERWLRAFHLWPVRLLEERATVEVVAPAIP
jgi:hypothetical protein